MKRKIVIESRPVVRRKRNNNIVFGRVTKDGRPVPAPLVTYDDITLPSVNLPSGSVNRDYESMETLDDYNALHYYGLDGLKNIDF